MTAKEFLERLQAAQSDDERAWLTLEFNLSSLRPTVQAAVWAAAMPHWFDQPFLAALLAEDGVTLDEATWQSLLGLSYVEPFAGRGYNIHERTRSLLLDRLWQSDRARYQELSRRAAAYCVAQDQAETHWRVETLYHQLLGDAPGAVDKFANQGVNWHNQFAYDKVEALIRPVLEAVTAGRLSGNAAAWAYYRQGSLDITYSRNLAARLNLATALDLITHDQTLQANCLQALGDVHRMVDEYEQARERYGAALPIYRTIGARLGEANCLKALGDVHRMVAEYEQARERYGAALPIYRTIGDRLGEANCLQALGDVHYMVDEYEQARPLYERVLGIYREIGARIGEMNALTGLADLDRQAEQWDEARQKYESILAVELASGALGNAAITYQLLGHTAKGAGDLVTARQHYQAALDLFTRIGSPTAKDVQANLEALQQTPEQRRAALEAEVDNLRRSGEPSALLAALQALCKLYRELEAWSALVPVAEEIVALQGADAEIWQGLGTARSELGDENGAVAAYLPAIALAPEDAMLRRNCANSLIKLQRFAEAQAHLEVATTLQGDAPYLALRWAELAQARQDRPLARQWAEEALHRRPDWDEAQAILDWANSDETIEN